MKYFVYIIKSINSPEKIYIGYTLNVDSRLLKHNEGASIYTRTDRPWKLVFYSAFVDRSLALNFEKYLKSHSGRAFLQKRFI